MLFFKNFFENTFQKPRYILPIKYIFLILTLIAITFNIFFLTNFEPHRIDINLLELLGFETGDTFSDTMITDELAELVE